MLNARTRSSARTVAVPALTLALLLIPAFAAVSAADSGGRKAAPTLDLNARMQQKLDARLNGQLDMSDEAASPSLDSTLSDRVDEKNAALKEQLDAQAESLTAAERGAEKSSENQQSETTAQK